MMAGPHFRHWLARTWAVRRFGKTAATTSCDTLEWAQTTRASANIRLTELGGRHQFSYRRGLHSSHWRCLTRRHVYKPMSHAQWTILAKWLMRHAPRGTSRARLRLQGLATFRIRLVTTDHVSTMHDFYPLITYPHLRILTPDPCQLVHFQHQWPLPHTHK